MATPRTFAKRMRAFAKDIPKQQNEIKQALATECLIQVVGSTPVDTGEARTDWITALGRPDSTTTRAAPYSRGGDSALQGGKSIIKSAKFGEAIYLTNNAAHIGALNDGHSKQAPRDFFKIALDRARGIMKRQAIRYGGKI